MSSTEIAVKPNRENLQSTSANNSLRTPGKVCFDLGQITHRSFGIAHIKGQFPLIGARVLRPTQNQADSEVMQACLTPWVNRYFDTATNPKHYENVIEVACHMGYYMYPFPPIRSTRFKLVLKIFAFIWIIDDSLEGCLSSKTISPDRIKAGLDQLLSVPENNCQKFVPMETFPCCKEIFHCLVDIYQSFHKLGYSQRLIRFNAMVAKYFDAMHVYAVNPIDSSSPEEAFQIWRGSVVFYNATVELIWVLESEQALPARIFYSDAFVLLIELLERIGSQINYILGVKGELENGGVDNFVLFKVIHKGIPILQAVEQLCQAIEDNVSAWFKLREEILEEFPNDPYLLQYIEILESSLDGQPRVYKHVKRYGTAGCVSILHCQNYTTTEALG